MVYGPTFLPDDRVEDVAVSAARVVKWEPRIGRKTACSQREVVRLREALGGRQGPALARAHAISGSGAGRALGVVVVPGAGAESAMRPFEELSALVAVPAGAWGAASGTEW